MDPSSRNSSLLKFAAYSLVHSNPLPNGETIELFGNELILWKGSALIQEIMTMGEKGDGLSVYVIFNMSGSLKFGDKKMCKN